MSLSTLNMHTMMAQYAPLYTPCMHSVYCIAHTMVEDIALYKACPFMVVICTVLLVNIGDVYTTHNH